MRRRHYGKEPQVTTLGNLQSAIFSEGGRSPSPYIQASRNPEDLSNRFLRGRRHPWEDRVQALSRAFALQGLTTIYDLQETLIKVFIRTAVDYLAWRFIIGMITQPVRNVYLNVI